MLFEASTWRLEGQVSLGDEELEIEASLSVEAAPMWVSPTHCLGMFTSIAYCLDMATSPAACLDMLINTADFLGKSIFTADCRIWSSTVDCTC